MPRQGQTTLDFNKAYNPYGAFNPNALAQCLRRRIDCLCAYRRARLTCRIIDEHGPLDLRGNRNACVSGRIFISKWPFATAQGGTSAPSRLQFGDKTDEIGEVVP